MVYQVDQHDVIVFVDLEWDRFATSNDAHGLTSLSVLGRPLWDFVGDATTCMLYRQLLQRVREGQVLRFKFRCDSPGRRRLMEMEMGPAEVGAVKFRTRTVSETERDPQALWERRENCSEGLVVACGWCKKLQVEGVWEEIEDAVTHLRLFEHGLSPAITHGICEECRQDVLATLTVSSGIHNNSQ